MWCQFWMFKKTEEILGILGYLEASGRTNIEFQITTVTAEMTALSHVPQKWGKYFRLLPNCEWEKYLRYAKASHVGLVASPREALGVAFVEILYQGVILVFPDKDWVYQIVPKDYPFIYRDKSQAYGLLAYIVDNYEEAWEKFKHVPAFIRERFANQKSMAYVVDEVRKHIDMHRERVISKTPYNSTKPCLARTVGFNNQMSWQEFTQRAEKYHNGVKFPQDEIFRRRRAMNDYELYLYMQMIEVELCSTGNKSSSRVSMILP